MRRVSQHKSRSFLSRSGLRGLVAIGIITGVPPALADEGEAAAIRAIEQYQQAYQAELKSRSVPARLGGDGWLDSSLLIVPGSGKSPREIYSDEPVFFCAGLTLEDTASQPATAPTDSRPASDSGESDQEALAKKLSNPIADLISVPFQSNFNFGGGVEPPPRRLVMPLLRFLPAPGERLAARLLTQRLLTEDREYAFKYLLNFQPVIPISLNDEWNVVSRTILPIVAQDDVLGTTSQGGLGDILQSFFFSPKATEPFIWGVGPVALLPTATDHNLLGSYRWGLGPTGVILKQAGPWTFGILANHLWSFSRDDGRKEVNSTFLQPFLSYTFKSATTLSFNTESTYDWIDNQWNVPLFAGVGQVVKFGKLPVQFQLGGQYWVEGPDSAPDWSLRFNVTFLFPK